MPSHTSENRRGLLGWSSSSSLRLVVGFVVLLQFGSTTANQNPRYEDKIFYCEDPWAVDTKNSISCNEWTYRWEVDELDPSTPPALCGSDFVMDPDELTELPDEQEPCLLWALTYGNLAPSVAPSSTPSAAPPVSFFDPDPPENMPPASAPANNSNEPPVGEPGVLPPPVTNPNNTDGTLPPLLISTLDLEPIVLTLVWPDMLPASFSLDRAELFALTRRHLLESLQAELGVTVVTDTNLVLTSGVPKDFSLTETVTGNVVFSNPDVVISRHNLQKLAQQAFQSNALELYQFRLQIAKDPALRQVTQVAMGTDVIFNPGQAKSNGQDDDEYSDTWSTLMIAIVASVGAAMVAVCCFAYFLVFQSKSKKRRSGGSRKKFKRDREIPELPEIPTLLTSLEPDEENPALISPYDEKNDDDEVRSIDTSVYSYLNDDTLSAAPSFLYSIHEADVSKDDSEGGMKSRQKKGLLWSVMDTLNTHFGHESDDDDEAELQKPSNSHILGPGPESKDDSNGDIDSLLYADDNQSFISGMEHDTSRRTPVKQKFEELWRDDEDEAINTTPTSLLHQPEDDQLMKTLKKSNRAGSKTTYLEPEPSPKSFLLDAQRSKSSAQDHEPKMVNRIPGDDDKISLPLSTSLNASIEHQDAASVHSHSSRGSHNSSSSSRSGSSRPKFEPTKGGKLAAVESARRKRPSNWSSDKSVRSTHSSSDAKSVRSVQSQQSTDSAKYRSLLNQGDINDGALFYNDHSKTSESTDSSSVIPATQLSYDTKDASTDTSNANVSSGIIQMGTVIQSLDKAWDKEKSLLTTSRTSHDSDDEESLYVDEQNHLNESVGVDENDNTDNTTADSAALNNLLDDSYQNHVDIEDKKDQGLSGSFDGIEKCLPFESDSPAEKEDEKKEDGSADGMNHAETMASF